MLRESAAWNRFHFVKDLSPGLGMPLRTCTTLSKYFLIFEKDAGGNFYNKFEIYWLKFVRFTRKVRMAGERRQNT